MAYPEVGMRSFAGYPTLVAQRLRTVWNRPEPLVGKRPNRIPDTGAVDKEHKYESATYPLK